ncbi:hypothetical protein WJX72_009197 [[Myrmecia] bisecta]|uniref:Uncharacterized protein n=1 Tax=[Myrmecia] bisecta TaxID=41462 RepID=A0AAW1Q7J7_9CHLO
MEKPEAFAFEVVKSKSAKRHERKVIYKGEVPSSLTVKALLGGHLQMLLPSMYDLLLKEARSMEGEKFVVMVKHKAGRYGKNDSSEEDSGR